MKPDAIAYPPRGLSREEAARYIGVGPTLFDELVAERRMPQPKRFGRRVIWDREQIDIYFSGLPNGADGDNRTPAQRALDKSRGMR